jgi:hypothetical protein
MAWSENFLAALGGRSLALEYKLTFLGLQNSVGNTAVILSNSSSNTLKLAADSVQITGTRIIPQRWDVSFGGFSVSVVGDIQPLMPYIRKGQMAELHCRLSGSTGWERIATGQLATLSGFRKKFQLVFRDLLSTLQNSLDARAGTAFSTSDPPHFELFYKTGLTTEVRVNYTAGDSTLSVDDSSIFKRKTGSRGMIKCTPSSGASFYKFFTGTSIYTINGLSSTTHPAGSDTDLVVGDTVTAIAWLEGSPWDIFGSIILSTGNGNNGPLDYYPEEWGIGGKLGQNYFDYADASAQARTIKRSDSGIYEWGFVVESPWTNGIRNLVNISTNLGQWPVYRMGKLSWRGCTDPDGLESNSIIIVAAQIKDRDIISINQHDFFNPDNPAIYRTTRIIYNEAGSGIYSGAVFNGLKVDSLPALSLKQRDGSPTYLHDQSGSDNRQLAATEDISRIKTWDLFVSEKIVLRTTLKFSFLVAGDIVEISSKYLVGSYDGANNKFKNKRALVLAVDYNFGNQSCLITLAIRGKKL